MKVNTLYIMRIGCNGAAFDAEIEGGGMGLYIKYHDRMKKEKGKDVALIDVRGTSPNLDVNAVKEKGSIPAKDDPEKDIGVYIIGHGGALKSGGLSAEQLSKLLSEHFKAIRKLCLVSCNLAKPLGPNQKGYLQDLCERLGGLGIKPMVAGYDGWVSVAFEGMEHDTPYKTGSKKFAIDQILTGKKTMTSPAKAGTKVSAEDKANAKVFGSRAGKVVVVRDINEENQKKDEWTQLLHRKRFVWTYNGEEAEIMEEGWSDRK